MRHVPVTEYYSAIKKNAVGTCYSLGRPWKHYAKWKDARATKITSGRIPFRWMSRSTATGSWSLRLPGAAGKVTGNDNKRTQLFEGWRKMFPLHNFVNILKITELNTSKSSILWHVNYISQYKNMRKKRHWPKDNFSVHQHIKRIINKMPNLLFFKFLLMMNKGNKGEIWSFQQKHYFIKLNNYLWWNASVN